MVPVNAPIPPSPPTGERPEENLAPKEQDMLNVVLEHFSRADYTLPDEDKETTLHDAEKFWLVRYPRLLHAFSFRC
jgi:hypothetical protein